MHTLTMMCSHTIHDIYDAGYNGHEQLTYNRRRFSVEVNGDMLKTYRQIWFQLDHCADYPPEHS